VKNRGQVKNLLSVTADSIHPGLSIDCIIFGFHEGTIKVLLNKFSDYTMWMLPGGFIHKDENVDDAAYRILKTRTGLKNVYLQQFHLFGNSQRTNLNENDDILSRYGYKDVEERAKHWLMQRYVSMGYYALVEYSKVKIESSQDEETEWFDLNEIPRLYSDHSSMIEKALSTIRMHLSTLPIGYELLPEKFTMTDLRTIYETILKKKLDRRNFQRKILSTGLIIKLEEVSKRFGIKTSTLFAFDKEKYNSALKNGFLVFE